MEAPPEMPPNAISRSRTPKPLLGFALALLLAAGAARGAGEAPPVGSQAPLERCTASLRRLAEHPLDPAVHPADASFAAAIALCTATADLRLRAEAHARFAEALQGWGDLDAAERQAAEALALSATPPAGLPRLVAHRTLYAVALQRGDTVGALRELQALGAAERAYAEELRRLQEAYRAMSTEAAERQQAIDRLGERNALLAVETERAERVATWGRWLLLPIGLGILALLALAWRSHRRQSELQQRMQVDALTGVHSRAYFSERATAALAAAKGGDRPMALVLIDLDHFSQINSRFGHLAGDRLLAAVGRSLRALETPGRQFGRLGGEEFAVLLPGAGLDEGLAFAERCLEAIAATAVDASAEGEDRMQVTASLGVVATTAAGYRLRDLLANADDALYKAKSGGRNRVVAAVVARNASGSPP